MKNKKNKKNKTQREQKERTIGARFKEAAEGFKERAKSMTSEEQAKQTQESEQPENQQPEQEACEVDIKALQEELEKAKAQSDEYLDLAQRKQAEFANYRRRTEGIRAEAYDDGRRDAIAQLLPVVDNLERALAAAGEEENALKSGVEMVLRQTRDALTKMGVEEIDPQGQPFDAELMNAVMQGSADEGEPGTVCMVLQKGYKLGERVIRHAMVKVVAG
ncbi:MAG: nucleotide exchange factor GrpE [Christensenellales bacterium]|nr:nucleotide exchange factor GrpE [Clostridiales bacterium]